MRAKTNRFFASSILARSGTSLTSEIRSDWAYVELHVHCVSQLSKLCHHLGRDEGMSYTSYYAARQRRAIAATRQRTFAGRRHHAARQRGALARWHTGPRPASYVGKQRSDVRTHLLAAGFGYRPTLTSNVVTGKPKRCQGGARVFLAKTTVSTDPRVETSTSIRWSESHFFLP